MSAVIRIVALVGVLGTVACGATTSGSSAARVRPSIRRRRPTGRPRRRIRPRRKSTPAPYGVVPAGQELDVRLGTTLSSKTAKVEQRFEATTVADVMQNGNVLDSSRINRSRRRLGRRSGGPPPSRGQPDAVVR